AGALRGGTPGVAGEWLVHAAKQAALLVVAANPIVLALVVLGASGVRSSRAPPASALAALALAAGGALLFAYAFFRADERYAATLASLSLPFAGLGLSRFASFCERDGFLRGKALVLVLLLAQLPFATRARNERKATWRDAGELVRSLGIARVAASDPRVAFYAGAAHVDLRGALRDAGRSSAERARAVLSLARAANASAIVLDATARDRKPADPIVKEVADLLPSPRVVIPIERRGAESVVVIALSP
ncbi:hypothetical protein HY251_16225, partial [bacterium]|nr:hypothetical protein [bacterium]